MLLAGSAAAGVRGAPPAVDKTCCDCQRDEKRERATRSVEKSFPLAFPTGHRQTEQAKKGSKTHTNQSKSKGCPEPAGNPASSLSSSSAGWIAQIKGKQINTAHRTEIKQQ